MSLSLDYLGRVRAPIPVGPARALDVAEIIQNGNFSDWGLLDSYPAGWTVSGNGSAARETARYVTPPYCWRESPAWPTDRFIVQALTRGLEPGAWHSLKFLVQLGTLAFTGPNYVARVYNLTKAVTLKSDGTWAAGTNNCTGIQPSLTEWTRGAFRFKADPSFAITDRYEVWLGVLQADADKGLVYIDSVSLKAPYGRHLADLGYAGAGIIAGDPYYRRRV